LNDDERQLWQVGGIECVMISCCSGAELQLRRIRLTGSAEATSAAQPHTTDESEMLLRELYPTKSDLYERARDLKIEHEHRAGDRI
jgi:hypothetical protein